jgi:hypothetical protein
MLIFVAAFLNVNVGPASLLTLRAAAAGGTYNIVNLSRVGSVSL